MPWAKRLGGPGTNFSSKLNLGTKTFVTNRARGLTFGPDETLAKKPYVITNNITHAKLGSRLIKHIDRTDIERTPAATKRAAGSFISSGKEKKTFIIHSFL